jgi:hypothetical protein
MRKWLSVLLVRLATKLRPENREAQEYFMKASNEDWATRKGSVRVVTTWGIFKRAITCKRGGRDGTFVYGMKRGRKTIFSFASFGDDITTFPDVEHLTAAQLYKEGYPIEEEVKHKEKPYGSKQEKTEEH